MRNKKLNRSCSYSGWSLRVHPVTAWVCSRHSGFFSHPADMSSEELACLSCPSLSECGCICEWPYNGRVLCPEWVPALCPELRDRLLKASELE